MMGKEFQSLGNLKKYELRVMLLMETLWQSFVPSDLVFEDEKEINSVISKLLLEVLIDLIKIKYLLALGLSLICQHNFENNR